MQIIQVEVTNACPHDCSNCTRFCGHQAKPFFVREDAFAKAVQSLEHFPGMVGVMGGEPTIHPNFDRLVRIYRDIIDPGKTYATLRRPVKDFAVYRQRSLSVIAGYRRGLWTSLGNAYYRHLELIAETFPYQCVNDHSHRGLHQALLLDRKSLGIKQDEWLRLRDACWVQNTWSASINPAGAYFCEVAAAIDLLFYGGRFAWPVEPSWWKRTPADFGNQLGLCELCSAALNVPRRVATEERHDVSPINLRRLERVNSPAVRRGRVVVFDLAAYDRTKYTAKASPEWYMDQDGKGIDNLARVASTNATVLPRRLDGLTVCVGHASVLRRTLRHNLALFDRFVVVTVPEDVDTRRAAEQAGAEVVLSGRLHEGDASFNKAALINDGLQSLRPDDWLLMLDADIFLPPGLRQYVMRRVLNPGCLYWTSRFHVRNPREVASLPRDWRGTVRGLVRDSRGADVMPWGFFHLFHAKASAFDRLAMPEGVFPTAGGIDHHWMLKWPADKRVRLDSDDNRGLSVVHVRHGSSGSGERWSGREDNRHWRVVAITGGNRLATVPKTIDYPCWVRIVRVATAEKMDAWCTERSNGPIVSERTLGFDGWGLRGGRWYWGGVACEESQYDLYQRKD